MSRHGELRAGADLPALRTVSHGRVFGARASDFFSSVDDLALAKRELIEGLNGRDSLAC